jgi:hypothetical protein
MAIETAFRKSMAWLVLLVLMGPGLAWARAVCCGPGMVGEAHCCSSRMPGMDSSRMGAMDAASFVNGHWLAAAKMHCRPVPEVMEFVERHERTADRDPVLAQNAYRVLLLYPGVKACSSPTSVFHFDHTSPARSLSGSSFLVLRI